MRKPLFSLSPFRNRSASYILVVVASMTLVSCTYILTNLPGVYTVDVQQGNMVDQDMINQLRPSMSKRQVIYIMGSPMLTDVFHQNRWDYLYSARLEGKEAEQKRISLIFDNEQLIGVQGDFKPSEVPVIKPSAETTVDVPKRDLEKTMWETITGFFGINATDDTSKTDKPASKPSTESPTDQLPL